MYIINFIIDYLVMIFLPINTYFILNDLDKNKLFSIFLVGILVDIMFNKYKPSAVVGVPTLYEALTKNENVKNLDLSFLKYAIASLFSRDMVLSFL